MTGVVHTCAALLLATAAAAGWPDEGRPYRATYRVDQREAGAATVRVDFSRLMARVGVRGAFETNSIRMVEEGTPGALAWNFEREERFSVTHHAAGTLTWRFPAREQGGERVFRIYFDTEGEKERPAPAERDERLTPNLLADGSFEAKPAQQPPWKMKRGEAYSYYPVWDDRAARSGTHAMRVETDARANCYGSTATVAVAPGRGYRMSIWYKVDAVGAGAVTPAVNFLARDRETKKVTKICTTFTQTGAKPGDWVQVERVLTPPAGTDVIWIGYGIHESHGAAWFDDADIRPAAFDEVTEIETQAAQK